MLVRDQKAHLREEYLEVQQVEMLVLPEQDAEYL